MDLFCCITSELTRHTSVSCGGVQHESWTGISQCGCCCGTALPLLCLTCSMCFWSCQAQHPVDIAAAWLPSIGRFFCCLRTPGLRHHTVLVMWEQIRSAPQVCTMQCLQKDTKHEAVPMGKGGVGGGLFVGHSLISILTNVDRSELCLDLNVNNLLHQS